MKCEIEQRCAEQKIMEREIERRCAKWKVSLWMQHVRWGLRLLETHPLAQRPALSRCLLYALDTADCMPLIQHCSRFLTLTELQQVHAATIPKKSDLAPDGSITERFSIAAHRRIFFSCLQAVLSKTDLKMALTFAAMDPSKMYDDP